MHKIYTYVKLLSFYITIPTEATTESPKRMRKFRIRTLRKRSRFLTIGLAPRQLLSEDSFKCFYLHLKLCILIIGLNIY